MRYSALLPTRNGGKFLRSCIDSILSQDHHSFELVISDNANTDETPQVIAEYAGDPRVKAIRLDEAVGVTENWNAAYAASSGDYVIMMGDDDYLLPGYFTRMDEILARHDDPDCVLYDGYSFVAPGSIAGDPRSFYSPHHFSYGPDLEAEAELTTDHKRSIVRDMFDWKMRIPLNMQTALVARRAADRVPGGFFQPPFPDHYALNALLLMDARWVFTPERLVIVGVSPKSFGHYVYSGEQSSGLAYLGIDTSFPGELPGSALINGIHVWLDRLLASFPRELKGVRVDRPGYVRRQVYSWMVQKRFGNLGWADLAKRFRLLSASDWVGLGLSPFDKAAWRKLAPTWSARSSAAQAQWNSLRPLDDVGNIAQFATWLRADQSAA